ncbi:MAG: hypothetical protein ACNS62_03250 [Candidatus Cyclobacteriaceae bacterium M3_2C_046]
MDHVVYLDHKAGELKNLIAGSKKMIIRGAMGRKIPYNKVKQGDMLYFIENKGDGMIKARAKAAQIIQTDKLSPEDSRKLVEKNQEKLQLNAGLMKRFAGKRYLVLIETTQFEQIDPFKVDRSAYGNMDDWLPVGIIDQVKVV